jgi:hypothetical protein
MKQQSEEESEISIFIEKKYGYDFLEEVKNLTPSDSDYKKYYEYLHNLKINKKNIFKKQSNNCIYCNKMILLKEDKRYYNQHKACEYCFILKIEGRKNG